jgi:hypothetical protein
MNQGNRNRRSGKVSAPRQTVLHGDCLSELPKLAACSIDTCITDPPYEIGFMGNKWDGTGVAFNPATWRAVYRVLKPGSFLLCFGGTRTFHRITCAIEDAGFEIRDCMMWIYGSGFPKSLDISQAIDKSRAGIAFVEIRQYLRDCIARSGLTQRQIKNHLDYPKDSGIVSHWVANSQPMVPTWKDWIAMKSILPSMDASTH